MRIITWNCNMAFRNKKYRILQYNPDILVIQECENPEAKGEWKEFSSWVWVGDNKNKGVGVFTRNRINVEVLDSVECHVGRYIIPLKVTRKTKEFLLFAVWAMNDTVDRKRRYIGQVFTALQLYNDLIDSESMVIGDFNWNVIWDKTSISLYGNLVDTVTILEEKELYSAYHVIHNCVYGNEINPTLFLHKKRSKPYHIDYMFIPRKLFKRVCDFWIGSYEDWIDVSDHMPILLEIEN